MSSGFNGSVRVWEWGAGLPEAQLPSSGSFLPGEGDGGFLPDGRVLSGQGDGALRSWVPGAGAPENLLPPGNPGGGFVSSMSWSREGTVVAVGDGAGIVTVHDLGATPTAAPLTLRGHEGPVWATAVNGEGRRVASGGADGTVRIWDVETGRGRILGRHDDALQVVAFSPDGSRLASAGFDGTIQIWDLDGAEPPVELEGHQGVVFDSGFSPDGERLASGGSDRTVRVWDLSSGTSTTIGRHETAVLAASFSPDGTRVLSTANDGVRVWDWEKRIAVFDPIEAARATYRAAFSPDGRRIVESRVDDSVRVVECETCGPIDDVRALAEERVTRELSAEEREVFGG